jgi:hypothetical protein
MNNFQAPSGMARSTIAVFLDEGSRELVREPLIYEKSYPMHIAKGEELFWLNGWEQKSRHEFEVFYSRCRKSKRFDPKEIRIA